MRHLNTYDTFINEKVGDERDLKYYANIFFGALTSPIVVPIWGNLPTENKINFLVKTIIDNYFAEKAEYEILESIKYDIEKPSELKKVRTRLRMLDKRFKKYTSVEKYMEVGFIFLKISNFFNIRNREDIDYIKQKVREEIFSKSEKDWISEIKETLEYNNGKVVYLSETSRMIRDIIRENPGLLGHRFMEDDQQLEEED